MQAGPQPQQAQQIMGGIPPQQQPQALPAHIVRQEGMAPPKLDPLPVDAAETLYVDNMTMDVTKREMAHIFRPFEGFKVGMPSSVGDGL